MCTEINFREKGKDILRTVFTKEQNVVIFENNIYLTTVKNLKKYENLIQIYLYNIYNIINDVSIKNVKHQELLNNIKTGKLYWKDKFYNKIIFKEEEQNEFLIKPFEVEEGVLTCKCGSKKVFSYQSQTRGMDEPSTTFATCAKCGSKWQYNG